MESSQQSSMEDLPEDLVEEIVARMPFPSIFKARELSQSWRMKFSPMSAQPDDDDKKNAAVKFQRLVRALATKWTTLFPVCLDNPGFCSAYDPHRHKWVRFPTPSVPAGVLRYVGIEGTLLCLRVVSKDPETPEPKFHARFHVVNLVTGRWKTLPACPELLPDMSDLVLDSEYDVEYDLFVRDAALETYRVMALYDPPNGDLCQPWYVQIYESELDEWRTKKLTYSLTAEARRTDERYSQPIYLDGVIYVTTSQNSLVCILAFDLEKGTFEGVELTFDGDVERIECCDVELVRCNAKLMMVISHAESMEPLPKLHSVLKVDIASGQLLEVARAPPDDLIILAGMIYRQCTDGDCLLFATVCQGQLVTYDVQEDQWAYVHYLPKLPRGWQLTDSLRPGLNPFAEVYNATSLCSNKSSARTWPSAPRLYGGVGVGNGFGSSNNAESSKKRRQKEGSSDKLFRLSISSSSSPPSVSYTEEVAEEGFLDHGDRGDGFNGRGGGHGSGGDGSGGSDSVGPTLGGSADGQGLLGSFIRGCQDAQVQADPQFAFKGWGGQLKIAGGFAISTAGQMFEPGACSLLERFGAFVYKGTHFAGVGIFAALVGTGISSPLINARKKMDPNFVSQNATPLILLNSATWAAHVGLSNNLGTKLSMGWSSL
ncbi:unnamed protein product [Calypogeia fissa]